jgi:hypothetical protein
MHKLALRWIKLHACAPSGLELVDFVGGVRRTTPENLLVADVVFGLCGEARMVIPTAERLQYEWEIEEAGLEKASSKVKVRRSWLCMCWASWPPVGFASHDN